MRQQKIIVRNQAMLEVALRRVEALSDDFNAVSEVIIRKARSKRSSDQNSFFHKLLADIADFTGDTLEATKLQMKAIHLEPLAEHPLPDGRVYVTYPSSADMSVKDLVEFCEMVEAWAMTELGFVRHHHER